MSLLTVTAAQRQTLRDKASTLATLSQVYGENARTPTAEEAAIVQTAIDAMSTAIAVIGGTSGNASVANGETVPATGTGTTATLVVAAGVLTGVTLA